MAWLALALAFFALLVALAALLGVKGLTRSLDDHRDDVRRGQSNFAAHAQRDLEVQRRLLARFVEGRRVDPAMVLEGRLWADVDAAQAARMVEAGGVTLVDVRTRSEVLAGRIAGARHIPLDELEERFGELPKDGGKLLCYCAGGARSAEACARLTLEGFDEVYNLEAGYPSWGGPVERGAPETDGRPGPGAGGRAGGDERS